MKSGVVNILKPPGMTSHDVVSYIRKTLGVKKVGHAGTLDPAAAGVLPVFIGTATRFIEYLADSDKAYRAELTLGFSTDTGDDTGQVIDTKKVIMPAYNTVAAILESFIGKSRQLPPMYSAVKINGKKLYEYARQGESVERKSREIEIISIALLDLKAEKILFDVECSKGTYIRTLCEDIGKKIGYPAVMSFLIRTRVGEFTIDKAYTLEEIFDMKEHVLSPVDSVLIKMPCVELDSRQSTYFINGRQISYKGFSGLVRVYDNDKNFLGVGEIILGKTLSPVKVIPWQKEGSI